MTKTVNVKKGQLFNALGEWVDTIFYGTFEALEDFDFTMSDENDVGMATKYLEDLTAENKIKKLDIPEFLISSNYLEDKMSTTWSGNVMNLQHFHDFYYLEALRAGIVMAKASRPELEFSKAVEKLETSVNKTFDELCSTMAYRIFTYIWVAALGEASYAEEMCEMQLVYDGDWHNYFPTEKNIDTLLEIFGQDWREGGYGGGAWYKIVECLKDYGKIPNAAFIDHAVDLEHNGGCVFDKTSYHTCGMECYDGYSGGHLKVFLNNKFSDNILQSYPSFSVCKVSERVYDLIVRYGNVIEPVQASSFLKPELEFLTPYSVEWGYLDLTTDESRPIVCVDCGVPVDPDDCNADPDGYPLCYDCYSENYAFCEHCNEDVPNDDYISNLSMCESCAEQNGYHKCENCGEWCKVCYCNPAELPVDADGIFEIVNDYNWTPDALFKYQYVKLAHTSNKPGFHIYMPVYKPDESGLCIVDIGQVNFKKECLHASDNHQYNITTPAGYNVFSQTTKDSFTKAVKVMNAIKDVIDWNTIQTLRDWQSLPRSKKDLMREIVMKLEEE